MSQFYSLPIEQTSLKLYEVDVQTEDGDECTYYIWQDPNEGDPPGQRAVNWLNEDEVANKSGKVSDGTWNVSEYPANKPDVDWDINDSLERVYGESVAEVNGRIFFDKFDYAFLPNTELEEDIEKDYMDWAKDNKLDLQVHPDEEE